MVVYKEPREVIVKKMCSRIMELNKECYCSDLPSDMLCQPCHISYELQFWIAELSRDA